ncbi:formamidopyrimidine-DNA glycosylase isoform X4 [Selaginella moellendorffii]|uniref:formamidopyrimidine-DNA glycosylase isoform X4 n=1 Tax=Selaginella moellendorffii TaxID=88036 RepID=UPI000D1CE095|nr:formamidopyrimidine-DNA glycosylase isoform X4 [Selaginella moellendorffii]|eukprot:XP_024529867.1 formamidopyrimidine-DNA glycosylase isoform X4 [Selaginella moellendorffii]
MPELPEVEAARRAVELHCKGLICRASVADDTTVIEGMAPFDMQRRLVAKRIVAAHRKGKQLWLELDEPPSICFQFGMAGAVYVKGVKSTKYVRSAVKDEDEWPSKYSKVHLVLDTGVEMSFTDKRRFARVRLIQDPRLSPPISELGPDAYTELPDETTFADSVAKKKTAIKAVLLDQSFIAGIGNWIADEVLYQSRIHPEQPASTLTAIDCERLRGAIKEVVMTAVDVDADLERFPRDWLFHHRWGKKPGSVLETAISVEGDSSHYPDDWIYQHREKKSGATVNGKKIEFITVGGRTSAYVPELQKYDGVPKKKTPSRKKSIKGKVDDENEVEEEEEAAPKKKAVSRKKKPVDDDGESDGDDKPKRKGGAVKAKSDDVEQEAPKKRGRPARNQAKDEAKLDDEDLSYGLGAKCVGGGSGLNPSTVAAAVRSQWSSFLGKFPRFREACPSLNSYPYSQQQQHQCFTIGISSCSSNRLSALTPIVSRAPLREEGRLGIKFLSYVLRKSAYL